MKIKEKILDKTLDNFDIEDEDLSTMELVVALVITFIILFSLGIGSLIIWGIGNGIIWLFHLSATWTLIESFFVALILGWIEFIL